MTTFTGNAAPNFFIGGPAADTFYFGAGNDSGFGGGGNDVAYLGTGNDHFSGGGGNDLIFTGGNQDVVDGGPGNDTVYLQGGTVTFTGGTGADHLIYELGDISSPGNAGGFNFLDFRPLAQHDHITFDATGDEIIRYDQRTGTFLADLDGADGPLGFQVAGRVTEGLALVEGRDWDVSHVSSLHHDFFG